MHYFFRKYIILTDYAFPHSPDNIILADDAFLNLPENIILADDTFLHLPEKKNHPDR
jgi:hypothetical protein